jgi:RNA polymerase sigma-70 factor (ECF subfamily)
MSDTDPGARERELIARCIRGEASAWDRLVDDYGPVLHDAARYTLRRVLGRVRDEDVENVVQGVLTGLCDKDAHRLKLFRGTSKFRTWLTSVTSRFALNYIRTEKRKGSLKFASLEPEAAGELPGRAAELPDGEERERLFRAMSRISPRERLILQLHYFDGLSYRGIAGLLRVPVNSVSPLLIRARESLRREAESR